MGGGRLVQDNTLEIEIAVCVIVRDILDHLMDKCHFALRKLSVLDVFAEKVAEYSAEVLVARIRKETAGVSEHSYKSAEKTK